MCSETKNWKEVAFHNFYLDSNQRLRYRDSLPIIGGALVTGWKNEKGYKKFTFNYKTYYVHQFVALLYFKDIPKGLEVDHINGNRGDNSIKNLRLVSHQDNTKNQVLRKNNRSGIMGVHLVNKKWRVRIANKEGERVHLGMFEDFFEACCARKSAEVRYNYHTNHGRSWL